jgi:hypothetical protein
LPGFRLSTWYVLFSAAEGKTEQHSCRGNEMIVVTSSSRQPPEQELTLAKWTSYAWDGQLMFWSIYTDTIGGYLGKLYLAMVQLPNDSGMVKQK